MSGKLKADLIIETEAGRYIVELQASGEPEDVRKHFQQLDTYALPCERKRRGTGEQSGLPANCADDSRPYQLHAMHVQLDLQFAIGGQQVSKVRRRVPCS
jgi:hypothetical protein